MRIVLCRKTKRGNRDLDRLKQSADRMQEVQETYMPECTTLCKEYLTAMHQKGTQWRGGVARKKSTFRNSSGGSFIVHGRCDEGGRKSRGNG